MLKTVLYMLVLWTTAVRLVAIIAVLAVGTDSLPALVLVLTSLTVLYGVFLLIRRFVFTLHLKHFVQFFAAQSVVFWFNLSLVSRTVLLQISGLEAVVVGSLLDILINVVAIYYCVRSMRKSKRAAVGDAQ